MDASAWQACTFLLDALEEVRRKKSPWKWTARQARLFACACCRRVWQHLDADHRIAVEVAERAADKQAKRVDLEAAVNQARSIVLFSDPSSFASPGSSLSRGNWNFMVICSLNRDFFCNPGAAAAATAVGSNPDKAANDCRALLHFRDSPEAARREEGAQCDLLRAMVGPEEKPAVDPTWVSWRDGTIPKLARAACGERDLPAGHLDRARLAILADALEEAGCSNASILAVLRGPGPLVRGCWAVEVLLA